MRDRSAVQDVDRQVTDKANGVAMSMRKTSHAVTRLYNDTLKPTGLRVTQFATLAVLQEMGCTDFTSLAEALGVDRTTLARNLRRMQANDLVEIAPGADRRQRMVTLTPQGTQALETALPLWERAQRQMVESIGQDRWSALLHELSAIAEQARQILSG